MVALHKPKQVRRVGSKGCIPQCHGAAVTRGPLTLRWKREARTVHFCTFTNFCDGTVETVLSRQRLPVSHLEPSWCPVPTVVSISPTGAEVVLPHHLPSVGQVKRDSNRGKKTRRARPVL